MTEEFFNEQDVFCLMVKVGCFPVAKCVKAYSEQTWVLKFLCYVFAHAAV